MRKLILAAAGLGALTLFPAAAQADHRQEARELQRVQARCRIALSQARTRREFLIIRQRCRVAIEQQRREFLFAERRHLRFDRFDDDDFDRGRGHGHHRGRGRGHDRHDDDDFRGHGRGHDRHDDDDD